MKLSIICIILSFFSAPAFAEMDCLDNAKNAVLETAAKALNIDESELKARHIGGESYDGDVDDGVYKSTSGEYFDIFLANDDVENSKALQMYGVSIHMYSDYETGEIFDCETYQIDSVSDKEWQDIYNTYL